MSRLRQDLERGMVQAERIIALTERCRPLDAGAEHERVLDGWRRGHEIAPELRHPPAPDLDEVLAWLDLAQDRASSLGPWSELYAARARELRLEALLALEVGKPDFVRHAVLRFPVDFGPDGLRALSWARKWFAEADPTDSEPPRRSDDDRDPQSLLSVMMRAVGEHRLPFRVLVRQDLLPSAATGDGVIVIRGRSWLRPWEVRRIVAHEVFGHALPRTRARSEAQGLFLAGTARGSDDEEGRALVIERRVGGFRAARRAELGRRHLAALAVRDGASFVEIVRLLRRLGAEVEAAVTTALRVTRGGGLGRELVYLPALSRVERALAADPGIERWLERGRIAVGAVPLLRSLELRAA